MGNLIVKMGYNLSWHYHVGRIVLGLIIVLFGYYMYISGKEVYVPYLHAYRRMLLPDSKNRIDENWTYEELFALIIQVVGNLFMFGGVLLVLNRRVIGGCVILLSLIFLLATQDNPFLIEYIKPRPKSSAIRFDDLARHLAVMGAVLYMMVAPPCIDDEPEHVDDDENSKKN